MISVFWLVFAVVMAAVLLLCAGDDADPGRVLLLAYAGWMLSALFTQVWVLLTARLQSKEIIAVSLGYGRILVEVVIGGALVQLRASPGPLNVTWFARQAPLARLRLWLGTALSVGIQAAAGVWLMADTTTGPMGAAVLITTAVRLVRTLRGPLDAGRILFVVPFAPSSLPLSSPANARAGTAVYLGDVSELQASVPQLTPEDRPELDQGLLALVEGRYAEAEQWGRAALERKGSPDGGILVSSAIVGAVDAGEIPPALALSRLRAVMGEFNGPTAMVNGIVPAAVDLARFSRRPDEAVAIARTQRNTHPARLWRAEADCSRAAALTAVGRFAEARTALGRARRHCAGLARIGHVERLIEQAEHRAPVEVEPSTT